LRYQDNCFERLAAHAQPIGFTAANGIHRMGFMSRGSPRSARMGGIVLSGTNRELSDAY